MTTSRSQNIPFLVQDQYRQAPTQDHEEEEPLEEEEDNFDSELESSSPLKPRTSSPDGSTSKPSHRRRHTLSSLFHPIIYLFSIWGFISLSFGIIQTVFPDSRGTEVEPSSSSSLDVYRPSTLPPGLTSCLCGSTPAEAVSLGCAYDTLSSAWLPPHCRDAELTAQFERSGPGPNGSWTYYADPEGKEPISVKEVAMLGGTENPHFYASRNYHIAHCMFYWQKYWRMRDTGVVMEEMYDTLRHAQHCGRLVLNPVPEVEKLIEVPVVMNGSGLLIGGEEGEHEHGHHHG